MLHGTGSKLKLIAAVMAGVLCSSATLAVSLTGLKRQGLDKIYGSYAPRGNCAAEPRLVIDDSGFTFRALGRVVKRSQVEYAVSYMGQSYDGISAVFFPFPVDDNNFGPVLMTVNDGEKRGVIRFDADLAPGKRPDPFHAALTGASPFILCKGTASVALAPAPTAAAPRQPATARLTPVEWNNLASLVGRYAGEIDFLDKGAIAAAIRNQLGGKIGTLKTNLSVVSPLRRQGALYYLSGNAEHQGGVEQAYVLIDAARRAVQVGLWERGKLHVHAPVGARLAIPADLTQLLNQSPPEDAVALPGTPWEVVPMQGRTPLAYVDAAGSPDIKSFSLFCEAGRPMMAVLLNKPAPDRSMTVSWNFAGRLVDIPVLRGNVTGTYWQASLGNSTLIAMLMRQSGSVMLRINGRLEGEALLAGAPAALRTAMKPCVKI